MSAPVTFVGNMTAIRTAALNEVADAGPQGLGFGRSPLQTRKWLRTNGLIERLPSKRGFFEPVREILTPLGEQVLAGLARGESPHV